MKQLERFVKDMSERVSSYSLSRLRQTPGGVAAQAALICAGLTHLYALVNNLHNYDDINQQPFGYGTGIWSGRWLLTLAGGALDRWGGNGNLPFLNGILFLLFLSAAAGVLVHALRIRNKTSAALLGMLFVVFPTVAATMMFRYTAVYYGAAVFLAVLAVWLLERRWTLLPLSALCMACSLGIYQAYMPLVIGLFVLLLIRQALEGGSDALALVKKGLFYCAALLLGLLCYYGILNALLALMNTSLNYYQGMHDMGKLTLSELPELVWRAVKSVFLLPVQNYCGVNTLRAEKWIFLLSGAASVLSGAWVLFTRVRRVDVALLSGVLGLAFVLAANFIVVMCPQANIYTMMVYSLVLILCAPLLIADCFPIESRMGRWVGRLCALLTALTICVYAYDTNSNYTAVYFANRQTENYLSGLITQVRMTEGFDPQKKWAVIGNISDPLLESDWDIALSFGGCAPAELLLSAYSWTDWIRSYIGYHIPEVEPELLEELSASEEVRSMPCWPSAGSIQVLEDTVIIKFEDPTGAP